MRAQALPLSVLSPAAPGWGIAGGWRPAEGGTSVWGAGERGGHPAASIQRAPVSCPRAAGRGRTLHGRTRWVRVAEPSLLLLDVVFSVRGWDPASPIPPWWPWLRPGPPCEHPCCLGEPVRPSPMPSPVLTPVPIPVPSPSVTFCLFTSCWQQPPSCPRRSAPLLPLADLAGSFQTKCPAPRANSPAAGRALLQPRGEPPAGPQQG